MGRRKEKEKSSIRPETRHSILAVLLLLLGVVLILASYELAGPAGSLIYRAFHALLGWGYYILPSIAVAVALLFIFSKQRVFLKTTLFGALALVLSSLGLIDIVFPGQGGLLGTGVGAIETPFGYIAAIIVTGALVVISLLLTFNASLNIRSLFSREEKEEREFKEVDPKVIGMEDGEEEADEEDEEDEDEVTVAATATPAKEFKGAVMQKTLATYVPPPVSLLKSSSDKPTSGDLRANANIIKRTLESFGIPVEMGEINIGPKVTRYTLKPAEGVKLTRITALNQDLSLALAAHPLRIEAPIPGKSLVGIEVPNKSAAVVRLGSLMGYPEFATSTPLSIVLGRDVTGEPIFVNIEKMPHLLVAGTTGSGKSIFLHSLLVSLLYKNSPSTLRFILIDPKRVELSVYDGIPHLVTPVIIENKKAVGVFRWAISEMERRYEVLMGMGARDIKSYNQKAKPADALPYLVIVIDELADLMTSFGREIETSIVRLAQMARATGIHLILATQRPSVEVITGLIKANITSRAALQVASQIDSRTILDNAGAEKLLGGGDMLFISSEFSKPKRIQGAYISEEEINKVAEFIRENNPTEDADEPSEIEKSLEASPSGGIDTFLEGGDTEDDDELYHQAVEVVREAKKASASYLQRRLKLGYARAARLIDIMEERGVVGPGDGAKPREVFDDTTTG